VVGGLRDTVAKAEARAERAIVHERLRADVLRDSVVTAEGAKREAEEASGRARDDARAAQDVAQDASAGRDEARKARGRLQRVLAAWRGE
jgi:hypothetical protein